MVLADNFKVNSPNVQYKEDCILSNYVYRNTEARVENETVVVTPKEINYVFKTETKVPKLG
jgi:myo-inositol-1-phosphate synthase